MCVLRARVVISLLACDHADSFFSTPRWPLSTLVRLRSKLKLFAIACPTTHPPLLSPCRCCSPSLCHSMPVRQRPQEMGTRRLHCSSMRVWFRGALELVRKVSQTPASLDAVPHQVILWALRLPSSVKPLVRYTHGIVGGLLSLYGPFVVWTGWIRCGDGPLISDRGCAWQCAIILPPPLTQAGSCSVDGT
jgi:hypothetical protein